MMKRYITLVIGILLVGGFISQAIQAATKTERGKKIDNVQIQLKDLKIEQAAENIKALKVQLQDAHGDKAKIDELNKKIDQQAKDLEDAQKQAAIRVEAKRLAAVKAAEAQAVALQVVQNKAYAATSSCGDAKSCIYFHESHNNPGAVNKSSGSCGIGQAWPCSKMPCSPSDYTCQDKFFTNYALQRYGSWTAAWSFWQANKYW